MARTNIYVVGIRQVQNEFNKNIRLVSQVERETECLKIKIVVFPLNCLILMEQGTRSDL